MVVSRRRYAREGRSMTSTAVRDHIAFLRRLRTVRHFRPDPVPPNVVDDLLEVARWSGSARNRQPWEFVVVRDRETLRALAAVEGHAAHLAGAPLGIVLVMAGEPDQVPQETFDEGRLSERISLAAAAHGVGSSIGWFNASGVDAARAILGIPPGRLVRTALSLGYPDREAYRARPRLGQPRKPLTELVHEERYG
jgi:nitroreductase